MPQDYLLGAYLDNHESLYTEYKEFCFKDNVYNFFTRSQIDKITFEGKLPRKFDNAVIKNLYKYITVYLPKYASSFHNTSDTIKDNMDFMIGINDNSEITGVPYSGCANNLTQYLQNMIQSTIKDNISDMCCLRFETRIEKCSIDPQLLDDMYISDQIEKQNKILTYHRILNKKYNKKRKQWVKDIMRYKGKLITALHDPSFMEEFVDYLKENHVYFFFKDTIENIDEFVFQTDLVRDYKEDKTNLMYWVIQYKDVKANELIDNKPIPPFVQKLPNIEFCACTQLSMLRSRLVKNNNKLGYYVININITKDNLCTRMIHFKDPRNETWRSVARYLKNNNTPHCLDVLY